VQVPVERQLPRRRGGPATAVTIGGERLVVITGRRADGTLGEVLLQWGKQGCAQAGLADAYAMAISSGLRYGVPLADLLRPGLGLRFTPGGRTDDPEIPWTRSVADYLCRRLAIDWLPFADRAELGVLTLTERVQRAAGRIGADEPARAHTGGAGVSAEADLAPVAQVWPGTISSAP
jgi:ribonucleoside-diphosphate reductase alpha chain